MSDPTETPTLTWDEHAWAETAPTDPTAPVTVPVLVALLRAAGLPIPDTLVSGLAIAATGIVPDVAPGALIESAWGNAIRDRTVVPYANAADRDAAAPPQPAGSLCILLDTTQVFERVGSAWRLVGAGQAATWAGAVQGATAQTGIAASTTICSTSVGTAPYPRTALISANLRIDNETAAAGVMGCRIESGSLGGTLAQSLQQYPATANYVVMHSPARLISIPAGTAAGFNLVGFRQSGTCTGKTYADPTFGTLQVVAVPTP